MLFFGLIEGFQPCEQENILCGVCMSVYAKKSQRDRSYFGACILKLPPFKCVFLQSELNINITFLCYGKHQQQDLAAHKKRKNVGLSPHTACSFFSLGTT